jgi:valyl-tRNA synthetase
METGYDILFFWVARMVMSGLEFTNKPPFHTIYLHGLVRDEKGRKMSKTTGNVVDPLKVMDEYGTDALRFTLLTGSTPGNDMNLSLERVAGNRNFSNKIWNATRFVVNNLGAAFEDSGAATWNMTGLAVPDRWILSRLNQLIRETTRLMDEYNYGEAGRQLYDFFWSEFADWYIEMAKIRLQGTDARAQTTVRRVLVHVLDRTLRMLHPFIPFVTEAAWQHLPHGYESLMVAPWPKPTHVGIDTEAETQMDLLMEAIRTIRNIRSEYNVEPGKRIIAYLAGGDYAEVLTHQQEILVNLARLDADQLTIVPTLDEKPEQSVSQVISGGIEIYLPLAGMIDLDAEKERLEKELAQLEQRITGSEKKLENKNFVEKAPADVVQRERDRLDDMKVQAEKIKKQIEDFG